MKAALIKDDTVKSHEVTVETFKGIVSLSGFVDTETERTQAGIVASRVKGVQSVTNNLQADVIRACAAIFPATGRCRFFLFPVGAIPRVCLRLGYSRPR